MSHAAGLSVLCEQRRFRAMFRVSALVCSVIWNRLLHKIPDGASPVDFLWALMFLKFYGSEATNRAISKADEKTFRKWSSRFVELISNLNVVRLLTATILTKGSHRLIFLCRFPGTKENMIQERQIVSFPLMARIA